MRKFTILFAVSLFMIGFASTSYAQTDVKTATATANATIITPIAITKVNDLNFGNIVATTTGGTVVLTPAGARTEAGVQLPAVTGTVSAASFTVTGQDGYAYSVTLPADGYAIKTGTGTATETMTLTSFISNTTGTLTGGTETLSVGATLNVVANQAAGTYIGASPFDVKVNYN
ncbi:MAG: YapH protein [Mucilaginibacter sp.]|nr:YapH protein [Mucilaginibacter sp.]MDB5061920.1 YapH protein [Mucilaginibacter sp.]